MPRAGNGERAEVSGGRAFFDEDFLRTPGGKDRGPNKVRTRHEKRMARSGGREGLDAPTPFQHVPLEGRVTLQAPVFATEDREKVAAGLQRLFPDVEWRAATEGEALIGTARDLAPFAEVLRKMRIRDAARAVLRGASTPEGSLRFTLNKQAACAGRANFVEGPSVLGQVEVEIRASDCASLAEELTWIEGESDARLFGRGPQGAPTRRPRVR